MNRLDRFVLSCLFGLAAGALSANASATNLNQFREHFAPVVRSTDTMFDQAASMRIIQAPLGVRISRAACLQDAAAIRAGYVVDPFEFVYHGGTAVYHICGGPTGMNPIFSRAYNGLNQFGRPIAWVIQELYRDQNAEAVHETFMDGNNRIVEIDDIGYLPGTRQVIRFQITALDPAGNAYDLLWFARAADQHRGLVGSYERETVVRADGSIAEPAFRLQQVDERNPARRIAILHYARSDRNDWAAFELPLTHSWRGGFYQYSAKNGPVWDRVPHDHSGLTVKLWSGVERCALGYEMTSGQTHTYPKNGNQYRFCENF